MTIKATKTAVPAQAQYAEKGIPPLMVEFAAWLEKETGVPVDARSVYLGSALREKFQKSDGNQKRLAALKKAAQPKVKPAKPVAKAGA